MFEIFFFEIKSIHLIPLAIKKKYTSLNKQVNKYYALNFIPFTFKENFHCLKHWERKHY